MERAPHFRLPRQGVNELMQLHRDLDLCEGLASFVEQLEVGDEAERIGHRHHALLHLHPVPGDACGLLRGRIAPERLPGARGLLVAIAQDARAQVLQVQLRRAAGLPQ